MAQGHKTFVLAAAEDCSGSASTTTVSALAPDIGAGWTSVEAVASLLGPTGGTLDVYIQDSKDGGSTWNDWAHFSQCAAATAVKEHVSAGIANAVTAIGIGTTGTPAPALAETTVRPGHPGPKFRAVYVTGSGVSAAAAQTITLICTRSGQ